MHAYGRQLLLRDISQAGHVFSRNASLTGAINRGIRKTQRGVETAFERKRPSETDTERKPWHGTSERRNESRETEGIKYGKGRETGGYGRYNSRNAPQDENDQFRPPQRSFAERRERPSYRSENRSASRYESREDRVVKQSLNGSLPEEVSGIPNRASRRRAVFGEPSSGNPETDRNDSFMERHAKPFTRSRDDDDHDGGRMERNFRANDDQDLYKAAGFAPDRRQRSRGDSRADNPLRSEWRSNTDFAESGRRDQEAAYENRRDRNNGRNNRSPYAQRSLGGAADSQPERRRRSPESIEEDLENSEDPSPFFARAGGQHDRGFADRRQSMRDQEGEDDEVPQQRSSRDDRPRYPLKAKRGLDAERTRRIAADEPITDGKISAHAPLSIPYTTAASEFLFGTFAVQEAIRAGRRQLHRLYIWRGRDPNAEDYSGPTTPENYAGIVKMCLTRDLSITEVSGESWSRLLNKMTGSRPHNGYILEASSIPKLPITALLPMNSAAPSFEVALDHQSAEQAAVNAPLLSSSSSSTTASIPSLGLETRFPLVLLLDRITDPGNLGAIIRSAYFLGVDAVLVLEHGTAPFNAITLKVAAGAAEYLPLLTTRNEHDLVKSSRKNGWRFWAAVSPESPSAGVRSRNSGDGYEDVDMSTALSQGPCVLMLGSEGEGLRAHLARLADGVASVENKRMGLDGGGGVDSLNVSVAAAVLAREFLRDPGPVVERDGSGEVVEEKDEEGAGNVTKDADEPAEAGEKEEEGSVDERVF